MNKKFHTLNGQGLCIHKEVRYGWRRVKQNGCGLLAAYNALGILNRPMDFFEIRKHFHRFWKPRFRGTSAFELRRFFRKQGLEVLWLREANQVEQHLKEGGVAVLLHWNRRFKRWDLPNPLKGAHLICATWEGDHLAVYNRFSNRSKIYRYHSIEELYDTPKLICALYLPGKTVRKATMEDLDALTALYDRTVLHLQQTVNYPKWEYGIYPCRDSIASAIEKGEQYLCEEKGELLGAYIFNQDPKGAYEKGQWKQELAPEEFGVIHTLAVSPEARGRNVGKAMVNHAILEGGNRGYRALRMDVVPENLPAIRLYEKLGFTYAGTEDLERNHPEIPVFALYERALK